MQSDSISYSYPYHFRGETERLDCVNQPLDSIHVSTSGNTPVLECNEGIPLPFMLGQSNGIFILLLFCFLFFAHIYSGGTEIVKSKYRLILTSSINQKIFSLPTFKEKAHSYFLAFLGFTLLSISLYETLSHLAPSEQREQTPFATIVLMTVLMLVYVFVKMFMYRSIGFVFDSKNEAKSWIQINLTVYEMLGICLFLPTLILIYSDSWHTPILVSMLTMLIVAHLILFYKLIIYFVTEKFNFLYLIAYLCTIEILPCIFLILGLVYLYRFDVLNSLWLLK